MAMAIGSNCCSKNLIELCIKNVWDKLFVKNKIVMLFLDPPADLVTYSN